MKNRYQYYHSVNENNYYFRELFTPDNKSKHAISAKSNSKIAEKRKHIFLFHRERQMGRAANHNSPVNGLRRSPITYYSINLYWHKHFYDFYDESIVNRSTGSSWLFKRFIKLQMIVADNDTYENLITYWFFQKRNNGFHWSINCW